MVVEPTLLKTAGSVVAPVLRAWVSRARDRRERSEDVLCIFGDLSSLDDVMTMR